MSPRITAILWYYIRLELQLMSLKSMIKYKSFAKCQNVFFSQLHYQIKLSCTQGHRRLEPIPAVSRWMQETPWTARVSGRNPRRENGANLTQRGAMRWGCNLLYQFQKTYTFPCQVLKKLFGLCENQDRRTLQLLIIVSKILLTYLNRAHGTLKTLPCGILAKDIAVNISLPPNYRQASIQTPSGWLWQLIKKAWGSLSNYN